LINNIRNNLKKKRLKIIKKYGKKNLSSFVIFHNDNLINEVVRMLGGTPTTGFLTLLILTKYKNVNSFGFSFGFFNKKYHYYYDNVKQDIGHKWDKELNFFKIMVHKNLFKNDDLKLIKNNTDHKQRFNFDNKLNYFKNFKFHDKQNRMRLRNMNIINTHRFLPPIKKIIPKKLDNNINKRLLKILENLEKD